MGEYVRYIQRVQRQYHAKLANDLKAAEETIAALTRELSKEKERADWSCFDRDEARDTLARLRERRETDAERMEVLEAACDSLNEDRERAIHAAFCAGVSYAVGNRELKPEELAEALRYTGKQSELSSGEGAEVTF